VVRPHVDELDVATKHRQNVFFARALKFVMTVTKLVLDRFFFSRVSDNGDVRTETALRDIFRAVSRLTGGDQMSLSHGAQHRGVQKASPVDGRDRVRDLRLRNHAMFSFFFVANDARRKGQTSSEQPNDA